MSSIQKTLEAMDYLDDIKEKISDEVYLKMSAYFKDIRDSISSSPKKPKEDTISPDRRKTLLGRTEIPVATCSSEMNVSDFHEVKKEKPDCEIGNDFREDRKPDREIGNDFKEDKKIILQVTAPSNGWSQYKTGFCKYSDILISPSARGKIKIGESATRACMREIHEELALSVNPRELKRIVTMWGQKIKVYKYLLV